MKINIQKSNLYKRDVSKIKVDISQQIEKTIEQLRDSLDYPSLHNKNIKCKKADNLFSIRVNKQYRILYFKYDAFLELYRLLNHDKYDRLVKDC